MKYKMSNSQQPLAAATPGRGLDDQEGGACPPLLLKVEQTAKLLGISKRTVWRLVSTGELPAPVRIPHTRVSRWRYEELVVWTASLRN